MNKPEIKIFFLKILSDVFYISLITFILFAMFEMLRPRFVSAYFNLNALLMIVLITGIITIINNKNENL
ncbi:MAG: hypothetical protein U9O55_04720 [Patescibacteria group bacterium]|nr:hypothetical protein [Patescibacteria group bacterium]